MRRGKAAAQSEWRLVTADPQPAQTPQPQDRQHRLTPADTPVRDTVPRNQQADPLLTAAVVVSRISAVWAAENVSTSRRMRIARWRAGRCCRLAISASRSDSRLITAAAGSSAGGGDPCVRQRFQPQDLARREGTRRAIGSVVRTSQARGQQPDPARLQRSQAEVGATGTSPSSPSPSSARSPSPAHRRDVRAAR